MNNVFRDCIWAIVTARKKSKSIKRKNITLVNKQPLINYSFDVLKKSKSLDKIIVNTDDEKIKSFTNKYKFEICHRTNKLSGDYVNSVDVVIDTLNKALKKYKYLPKWFILIQPTSIFLTLDTFEKLISGIKKDKKARSAQTIVRVPHQFHAFNQRSFDGQYTKFIFPSKRKMQHNKQTKTKNFAYGNLIASKTNYFLKNKSFFINPSLGIEISKIKAFDVDDLVDLSIVNQLIKNPISRYEK